MPPTSSRTATPTLCAICLPKKITETRKVTHQNYRLSFHANSDSEVIERLNSQENVTDYIRQLVLRDIKTDDVKN